MRLSRYLLAGLKLGLNKMAVVKLGGLMPGQTGMSQPRKPLYQRICEPVQSTVDAVFEDSSSS
jgi:hypothetical protein